MAKVAKRWLTERYRLLPETVECRIITKNPADYSIMYAFFGELLDDLPLDGTREDVVYLELSGGTPQMTSMLLVRGVEYLGERAVPLYIAPQFPQPFALNVGRELFVRSLSRAVCANLDTYSYRAAYWLMDENEALFRQIVPSSRLLTGLLCYAHHRLNFNFEEAVQALVAIGHNSLPDVGNFGLLLSELERQVEDRSSAWLLSEVVYNAEIKLHTGQYADFLSRIFRFTEGAQRYLAVEKLGVRCADAEQKHLDKDWLNSVPGLQDHLSKDKIRLDIPVTQITWEKVNRFLCKQSSEPKWRDVLDDLSRFDRLKSLRNQSVVAHNYEGVSEQKLVANYGTAPECTLSDMKTIGEALTGLSLGNNPFDTINDWCRQLLPSVP